MFDLKTNAEIARQAAAEGMILLKNDHTLPLKKGESVCILGEDCLGIIRGGGGSADVNSLYTISIYDGLRAAAEKGDFILNEDGTELAKSGHYSVSALNKLAGKSEVFFYTLTRYATEGFDRGLDEKPLTEDITGDGELYANLSGTRHHTAYHLTTDELAFLQMIEDSQIRNVVLIANIAGLVDFTFLENFSKIKAVLLAYLPGMEGGNAIADVLTGRRTPSGKLTDTIVKRYQDYPSSATFNVSKDHTDYEEGIFVGYRYFETFCKDTILFPFGFGLSYTAFSARRLLFERNGTSITVRYHIQNIGGYPGKEVLQAYLSKPGKNLSEPKKILCAFQKTPLLNPQESGDLSLTFDLVQFASFDETGETGHPNCMVLEAGEYTVYVGNSSENCFSEDRFVLDHTIVVKELVRRIASEAAEYSEKHNYRRALPPVRKCLLKDVEAGKCTYSEFVAQLTDEELLSFAHGQMCDFPMGTSGIGNLEAYGVPNIQTADGPAGLRKSEQATCMPCATLLASTWDEVLIESVGKAIGEEGVATGVDVLLAPGINLHRDPLCGRNFEYYSEDPLLAGKCAAAMIRGVQSAGMLACIKHFFANNRENYRMSTSSNMSERTAREIYLKPFEIALKEAKPAFLMTSYNLVNGRKCSTNAQLLRGILRDEWQWEGAVMTDWRNDTKLWQEILAGNNIKMPMGYPDEVALTLDKLHSGVLIREDLEENAIFILKAIVRSKRYKNGFFGISHAIPVQGKAQIPIVGVLGFSSTGVKIAQTTDGKTYFHNLGADRRRYPSSIVYKLDFAESGEYEFSCRISTGNPLARLFVTVDEAQPTVISCQGAEQGQWKEYGCMIHAEEGVHRLTLMIVMDSEERFEFVPGYYDAEDDFALSDLAIERIVEKR